YKAVHGPIVMKNGLDKQFQRFFIVKNRKQKYGTFFQRLIEDVFVHPQCAMKACWKLIKNYPNLKCGVIDYLDIRSFFDSGIDIIHSPFSTPRIIDKVYLLSKILNTPFTLCFRAHDLYYGNNMHEHIRRSAVIKEAAQIITIAGYNRDFIDNNLAIKKNIKIIHSAIDPEIFQAKGVARSSKSIIAVGRLDDQKGVIYLIKACHILHARGIEYECTIIGEGPEKEACQKLIAELRIPNMHLIDYLPNEAVKEHLDRAAVFVLPCEIASDGRRDILANALKEAMAMQIPVITSRMCGIEELVDDGVNGMLVPPQNPEALADAIEKIMNCPDLRRRMGEEGRKKIESCFNIKTEVQKLEEILTQAVPRTTMRSLS
ncbi:MAG TPA: glycosyltransferase family 4 protein, partial [Parachlamydiaceae bacterium]|nr:glycosyltransferase family 4 protein [Parachlamydiaceae bacterium]